MEGTTPNGGPGFKEHPAHKVTIDKSNIRFTARHDKEVLAESTKTLILTEASYPPVTYFPFKDVNSKLLTKSENTTYCPFKGDASYWDFEGISDIAWSYETPYDEVMDIKGYVAFYPDKVEIETSKN